MEGGGSGSHINNLHFSSPNIWLIVVSCCVDVERLVVELDIKVPTPWKGALQRMRTNKQCHQTIELGITIALISVELAPLQDCTGFISKEEC